ncbi:hypothetical protein ACMDB5_09400 [Flavobacterium sp. W1B]|uniref:hypothetical protein n=1 Tax=Flavobacterium sp. W1B TaxID=3394146 RepID=UPI0039BD22A9
MKTIYRLILPFAILMGFLSSGQCIAKDISGNKSAQVITTDSTEANLLFISPFVDSCQKDLNLSDDVNEEDSSNLDYVKSAFLLNSILYNTNSSHTAKNGLKDKQSLLGNMIPVRNMPRYILFHTLQIHF